ncbi:uncharacterized protein LOC119572895 [Penaeus monodon]|uniref:uncharacterized protein LOC119572895 n=1 Tax=Penaeus monodon TaxID=6687 RepID=UPI0018A7C02A|nr:uncharacterized protein LOC119572895 [Penaeus monodon]
MFTSLCRLVPRRWVMKTVRNVACFILVASVTGCIGNGTSSLSRESDCNGNSPDCFNWILNVDLFCNSTCDSTLQYRLSGICKTICMNSSLPNPLQCNQHGIDIQPLLEFSFVNCSTGQQYWQHPMDDNMFIECDPSGPRVKSCEPGTVWDQGLLKCTSCRGDHPDCSLWVLNIESFCKSMSKNCSGHHRLVKICQRLCGPCDV